MIEIPSLTDLSPEEIKKVEAASPAFSRYEKILNQHPSDERSLLRIERNARWMRACAATILKSAKTKDICLFWSQTAREILSKAWSLAKLDQYPAALMALGKLGANELNLSSDVDILVICGPEHLREVERGIRRFRDLVATPTEFGFCFRLDFDLRPGGRWGPVLTTPSQFEDHYWNQGETWEKMALVRLDFVCGSQGLGKTTVELARRFAFRRFLDYTLLDDMKAVRQRIHRQGFEPQDGFIHLKLERGGIRDIEMFVNAIQILKGGKNKPLQTPSTEKVFRLLEKEHLVSKKEIQFLRESYWEFRHYEHIAQAHEDRQTHFWDTTEAPAKSLLQKMARVDRIVSGLLGQADEEPVLEIPTDEEVQKSWLHQLGFSDISIREVWPRVISVTALSRKTQRDEQARRAFLYQFIHEIAQDAQGRDLALALLADFARAIRAKATFFSMFNREPLLVKDLAKLFSLSPYLGSILSSRPELLDNFILNSAEAFSGDFEKMLDQMAERKLLTELWAATRFLDDYDLPHLFRAVTETADAINSQLLTTLSETHEAGALGILCLGKWGGRELGLRSDLDFVFICETKPTEAEHKVARRLISRLSDAHRGGSLYEMDLRLRPLGHAGALLIQRESLFEFLHERAEIWERQAYLRARPLSGEPFDLGFLSQTEVSRDQWIKLNDIRQRLHKHPREGVNDLKFSPGGMSEIEFSVQLAMFEHHAPHSSPSTDDMIHSLQSVSGEWSSHGEELWKNYLFLRRVEQAIALSGQFRTHEIADDGELIQRCARVLKTRPETLSEEIGFTLARNRELLRDLDPRQRNS